MTAPSERRSLLAMSRTLSDEDYVAALGVLRDNARSLEELSELALMLGYGEQETRERYEAGLVKRRQGRSAA